MRNAAGIVACLFAGTLFCGAQQGAPIELSSPVSAGIEARAGIDLADAALRCGFPGISRSFLLDVLAVPSITQAERDSALLILASVNLSQSEFESADKALSEIKENSQAKTLRKALVEIGYGNFNSATADLDLVSSEKLSDTDLPWFYLAQGILSGRNGDFDAAKKNFAAADSHAVSSAQRLQFGYVRAWDSLLMAVPSEIDLEELRTRVDAGKGTVEGAKLAKLLIVALARDGKRAEALEALKNAGTVPQEMRAEFDILEGLLQGSPQSVVAREAFKRALRANPSRELQRIAMSGLLEGVEIAIAAGRKSDAVLAANEIEEFFNSLSKEEKDGTPASVAYADLEFFTRARIARAVGNDKLAARLASELLARNPTSNFAADSIRLLLGISIEAREYRRAATLFERLRDTIEDAGEKARINILIADCHFLSGDYRLAADAYSKIDLRYVSQNLKGALFSQQLLSEIKSGRVLEAAKMLDERKSSEEGLLGWEMRAECIVIESLRDAGKIDAALARCEKFLAGDVPVVDFRIRVLWLQALLGMDSGRPELAVKNADEIVSLASNLPADASTPLKDAAPELISRATLLKIRAFMKKNDEASAAVALEELRTRFPKSVSAVISYIEEARFFSAANKPQQALLCYEKMTEHYGADDSFNEYLAIAYFEAAQEAATLGRPRDAVRLLDSVAKRFPTSPLVFYARMRQADFFRVLNDFDSALAVYDSLITSFPDHVDIRRVEACRADCLLAAAAVTAQGENVQKTAAFSAYEKAMSAYERLFSLPEATCGLMAEVGYKWGYATAQAFSGAASVSDSDKKHGRDSARKIYWRTVNDVFNKASSDGTDPAKTWGTSTGYWLSRCLFAIAESYEEDGDFDGARRAYTQIINWGGRGWIPGMLYAQTRMEAIASK